MSLADVDEVMAIEAVSFPSKWQPGAYENELRNRSAHYYVARAGSRVVGYAGMWATDDEAHVTTLAVHPDMRRRGIGQTLLVTLLDRARQLKVSRMTLEVREANTAARQLYERHGFVPIAHLHRYYSDTGEDGVVMWLNPLPAQEPDPMRLIVLRSVHETMRAETFLKQAEIPHRVIPKPVTVAADCGLAIIFELEHEAGVLDLLAAERLGIQLVCDYAPRKGGRGGKGA